LLEEGRYEIVISVALVLEYEEALLREVRPDGVSQQSVADILDYVCRVGKKRTIELRTRPVLTDPDDEFLVELAAAAGIEYIVTHNVRDFRGAAQYGVRALRPRDFLELLKGES
jgi:predicted nucleic acid-binding protein